MTRIEFEAEIPLIEKKGGIIQFPEIWVDTGGDGKTKVVTWISGNLSSVHFMIWRKNTQVSKVFNIQIRVLSVWSASKTNRHLVIINHNIQSLALQDIENTQKQQPWYKNEKSVQKHQEWDAEETKTQSLYCESQLFYAHTHHTLLTLAIGIPHISHFLDIT